MRVIFAGTPEFAQVALADLLRAGYHVPLVLTQPDRPAGRGMQVMASPVKQLAQQHGIAVCQARSLRLDGKYPDQAQAAQAQIEAAQADVMVVAAYGLVLPQCTLDAPRLGCMNIHASLLPRWRGAAPIHRAIEAGDAQTGITIMQMDAGLDTGAMLLQQAIPIEPQDTTASLHDKLAALGGQLMVQALGLAATHSLIATPQALTGVSYAEKISKDEAAIDWHADAALLARKSRAFDPFPGCTSTLYLADGQSLALKIWRMEDAAHATAQPAAVVYAQAAAPGAVVAASAAGIAVACGPDGKQRLWITVLQKPGGKRLAARDFLAGSGALEGAVFRSSFASF